MSVYSGTYAVYERLASAKMNAMVAAINSHNHDGTYGVQINFTNLAGTIDIDSQIPNNSITSEKIKDGTIEAGDIGTGEITTVQIQDGTITIDDLDTTSIHLDDSTGYAVYAP
jgi:hypothetical protein